MAVSTFGTFVDEVIEANRDALALVADAVLATLQRDGLVWSAGAGHSLAAVMETFYRAGGITRVRPLWDVALLPLGDAARSTAAERTEGLGLRVVERSSMSVGDTAFVFSNSGINRFPVEVAQASSRVGATVVAVTSVEASAATAARAGARLMDVADLVLDTHVPPGDVSRPAKHPVTSPLSSLATNALWAAVLERVVTADPLVELWRSANVEGNDAANADAISRLRERIPELGSA